MQSNASGWRFESGAGGWQSNKKDIEDPEAL